MVAVKRLPVDWYFWSFEAVEFRCLEAEWRWGRWWCWVVWSRCVFQSLSWADSVKPSLLLCVFTLGMFVINKLVFFFMVSVSNQFYVLQQMHYKFGTNLITMAMTVNKRLCRCLLYCQNATMCSSLQNLIHSEQQGTTKEQLFLWQQFLFLNKEAHD